MRTEASWVEGPERPRAAGGEVHVWLLALDAPSKETNLSPAERERAERFRFDRDRRRYIAAHAQVRELLGRYAGAEAASLRFAHTAHGKPYLPGSPLRFNLSHAHELAILAVAREREIGCDIEYVSPDVRTGELAARFFSPAERAAFGSLEDQERHRAFFRCWTRKEAFVKARGEGLSLPLEDFDVSVTAPARLLATRPDRADAGRWWLAGLSPGDDYEGAVCVAGPPAAVRRWLPSPG